MKSQKHYSAIKDTKKKKEKNKVKSRPKTKKTVKAKTKPVNTLRATVKTDKSVKVRSKNESKPKPVSPKIIRKFVNRKKVARPIGASDADAWILEKVFNNPLVSMTPTGRGVRDMLKKDVLKHKKKKMANTGDDCCGEVVIGNIRDVPMPALQKNNCGTFGCKKKALRSKAYCADCNKDVETLGYTIPKRKKDNVDFQYDREQEEIEI